MQGWLGHADPGFTLRTYVHLINEGQGDADFLDESSPRRRVPERPTAAYRAALTDFCHTR